MIKRVGSGAGEFAVGSGDEPPFMQQAKRVSKAMEGFEGDTYQGTNLSGRVKQRGPSEITHLLFHKEPKE